MRFAIVLSHVSKVLRLPRKSGTRSYEVPWPWLSCKIILADLKIWCSKMQPLSGNLLPDLRTCLGCLLYCACHATCIFADVARLPSFFNVFEKTKKPTRLTMFDKVPNLLCFSHSCFSCASQLPSRTWGILRILTSSCASRHSGVHFSKSAPGSRCFVHSDFEMCFAPQRRAFFQKCSGGEVFLYILTSKCASCHNGVHFSTSQRPKELRTWGFVRFAFEMHVVPQWCAAL